MPKATTILVVALLGAASAAQAARPLQTDDAGVLDRGDCEVEGATQRFSAAGAAERTAALQFGCGVGAATQLALAVTRSRAAGVSGSGVVLSGKTAIGSAEPALALAWSVSAAGDAGAAWRHTGTALALLHSRPLTAELTLHANLGHERDETAARSSTRWGLAIEHAGFGAWAPMGELFGDHREAPCWHLGLRYTAVPKKGLRRRRLRPPTRRPARVAGDAGLQDRVLSRPGLRPGRPPTLSSSARPSTALHPTTSWCSPSVPSA